MNPLHRPLPSPRARRALALTAVSVSLLGSVTYWLATSGGSGLTIAPAPGLTGGQIADVITMSATVTRSNGNAQLQEGKTLAKADIAKDFTNRMRVAMFWSNTSRSKGNLVGGGGQIRIGIYHPVSITTGGCTTGKLAIVDAGTTFCGILDSAAPGSPTVSEGQLLLAESRIGGWLRPTVDASANLTTCATDTSLLTAWCQPAGLDPDKRRIYVIASLLNPAGTVPPGQQTNVANLAFFVRISRSTSDA